MKFNEERIQRHVRKMTNWQRNQWARAGYPTDDESLEKFNGDAARKWGATRSRLIEARMRQIIAGRTL